MPQILVPIPWTEQPLEQVKIAKEWAGRIPNALVQSLDMSVDGSPITTIGTVGKVVNAGGVMSSHASSATNIQRTTFRNPYATGTGVGFWLLVQFIATTNQDKVIAGFGSDSGSAGNTIFALGVDVDGTLRSLHGGSNSNSAWQDSNVVVTDGMVHTALMYTATSISGSSGIYKGFLDGKKYLDFTELLTLGNLSYQHIVAGGIRRTTDLSGFDGNVGLVAVILDDMTDAVAESLTLNPWQIFEDEEFPVWFTAATGSATLAQAIETDTAQVLSSSKTTTLSINTNSDIAQALSSSKVTTLGIASETDVPVALSSSKSATANLATGTDVAQALSASKFASLGVATETSTAQALTTGGGAALGAVTDTSTAQALTTSKTAPLSQVTNIDTPVAVSVSKSYTMGVATETDTAVALTAVKSLQTVVSTDTATSLNTSKSVTIGMVVDMMSPQTLATSHTTTLSTVVTTHTALALTASGGTVLSLSQADLNAIAAAVWAKAVEGLKAEEMMRIMLAALAGKREGLGTATEKYMGVDGVTPRITLTPDANGNGTPTLNGAP